MKNGHVCLRADKNYYSVPYRYIGEKVKLLYTDTRVEIYYRYQRTLPYMNAKYTSISIPLL